MKKWFYILLLYTLVFASQPHSLIGFRGLIFTPSSSVFPIDGESGFGYSYISAPHIFIDKTGVTKYNHLIWGSLVFIPRIEFNALLTLAPGSPGHDGSDTYKDFALFAHIYLKEQSKQSPSIMLGIHDFYSYSYYNSLFLSMSKSLELAPRNRINIHLGYGVDWLDIHYGDVGDDAKLFVPHYLLGCFGGIEYSYKNYVSFLIEYDTHQINTGLNLNLFNRIQILITMLNTDTFSFGIDYKLFLL